MLALRPSISCRETLKKQSWQASRLEHPARANDFGGVNARLKSFLVGKKIATQGRASWMTRNQKSPSQ
jgi:hypothetical protein